MTINWFNKKTADRHLITPTLFVGLGGTGHEILRRVRSKLDSYYGDLNQYAGMFQFRHIDTSNTHVGDEHINATIANPSAHTIKPNIASWFPKDILTNKAIISGASCTRPFGRLAFFANYNAGSKIQDKLNVAMAKISGAGATPALANSYILQQKRLAHIVHVDAERRTVIIVASIAGGTGSGMLIDTLAAIQNELKNDANANEILVYLLTPGCFTDVTTGAIIDDKKDDLKANGYACLKELEFFQSPFENKFDEANWIDGQINIIKSKLADRVYLFTGHNIYGNVPINTTDIYNMVSESIFKDYTIGTFADKKRETLDNDKPKLQSLFPATYNIGNVALNKQYAQSFQSQGYASLKVPHDQLINACTDICLTELIEYWESLRSAAQTDGKGPAPHIPDELKFLPFDGNYCPNSASILTADANMLLKSLLTVTPANISQSNVRDILTEYVHAHDSYLEKLQKTRANITVPNKNNKKIDDDINKKVNEFSKTLDKHSLDNPNDNIYKSIDYNKDKLLEYTKTILKDWFDKEATSSDFIQLTDKLNTLRDLLESHKQSIDDYISKLNTTSVESTKAYQDALTQFKRIKEPFLGSADGVRYSSAMTILDCAFSTYKLNIDKKRGKTTETEGWLTAKLMLHAYNAYSDIIGEVINIFNDNIENYLIKKDKLENVKGIFNKILDHTVEKLESSMYVELLYKADDKVDIKKRVYDECLQQFGISELNCDVIQRQFFRQITEEYLKDAKYSFQNFREQLINVTNTEDCIKLFLPFIKTIREKFQNTVPEVANFWRLLQEKYKSSQEIDNVIDELITYSSIWIQKNNDITAAITAPTIKVGIPALPKAHDGLSNLKNDVIERISKKLPGSDLIDLATGDELIISQTSGAMPLCYIQEIKSLKDSYNKKLNDPIKRNMHITVNDHIFEDVIYYQQNEIEAYIAILQTILLAIEFNIIEFDNTTYCYTKNDGTKCILIVDVNDKTKDIKINKLVESLNGSSNLKKEIEDKVYEKLARIHNDLPRISAQWTVGDNLPNPTTWEISCYLNKQLKSKNIIVGQQNVFPMSYYVWEKLLEESYKTILNHKYNDPVVRQSRQILIKDQGNLIFNGKEKIQKLDNAKLSEAFTIIKNNPGSFIMRNNDDTLLWYDDYPVCQQPMRICSTCNNALEDGYAFCPTCGQRQSAPTSVLQPLKCKKCGSTLKKGQSFCPKCGEAVLAQNTIQDAVCKNCGKRLNEGASFCDKCGTPAAPITSVCSNCGKALNEGASFCDNCGASTAPITFVCSNCGKALNEGAAFCDNCGAATSLSVPQINLNKPPLSN